MQFAIADHQQPIRLRRLSAKSRRSRYDIAATCGQLRLQTNHAEREVLNTTMDS